jgi:hypothetical protein
MLNKITNYINLFSLIIIVYLSFYFFHPTDFKTSSIIENDFYLERALKHVKNISDAPHYLGSSKHKKVRKYLINELQKLGLDVKLQKQAVSRHYPKTNTNVSAVVENIIVKIKGSRENNKSVLLMSHYDSAPYSSMGASDAASGVAVILEGIRGFLENQATPENDIILLFTDAEELGLLGAKAFIQYNKMANDVGIVLNFEARGTSGNSFMLMETNSGNQKLLEAFNQANTKYPNSSSLHYSIYKLLPSDMDMTIFREDRNIQGFNFAFIDNHFNYHTYLDNLDNLSLDSLAHQAHYLVPLLKYFSTADLTNLTTTDDDVFFQIPLIGTVAYAFSSTLILSIINLLLLTITISYGIKSKQLNLYMIWKSFIPLFKTIIIIVLLGMSLLKFIYWLHPQYNEILQRFPYNGYDYILFFYLLTASVSIWFYQRNKSQINSELYVMAPIIVFIIIGVVTSYYLPGAHFISLTGLFVTIALLIKLLFPKISNSIFLVFSIPAILILLPLIYQIPVAISLSITPYSCVLIVLLTSAIAPSLMEPKQYKIPVFILFLLPLVAFIYAETKSSISVDRPLPVSLNYYQNDEDDAYWLSYDRLLSDWTQPYFAENSLTLDELSTFNASELLKAKNVSKIDSKKIPTAQIELKQKRNYSDRDTYKFQIKLSRNINKLHLRTLEDLNIYKLKINDFEVVTSYKSEPYEANNIISTIHNSMDTVFNIELEVKSGDKVDLNLIEISNDLLSAGVFNVTQRGADLIAKPYGYSDLVITKTRATF